MKIHAVVFAVLVLAAAGCQSQQKEPAAQAESKPQLFAGLGSHHRKVTTGSAEAQKYFDQGLSLAYAFNHDEAIRSFTEAARLDPDCAMAWWGVALCNGPHINNPAMSPAASAAAWSALQKARAAGGHASPVENELITALGNRYADPAPEDRSLLDAAYASAMRTVYQNHRDDADIACLFAESMMDLRPWDLWMADGQPQPGTQEILAALEHAMELDPKHPAANHLYIHAVEASPAPQRGVASADRLRKLMPASGHMVHMPAHIDIRTGQWEPACEQNRRAIVADAAYRKLSPRQGFYRIYMAHNNQFLAFACMMQGRRAEALKAAHDMVSSIPEQVKHDQAEMMDPFLTMEMDVQMRFGMWNQILAFPEPQSIHPVSRAMWRFMRGVALAALGRVDEARSEQGVFRSAVNAVPEKAMISINTAHKVLEIADRLLEGEILLAQNRLPEAAAALRQGVAIEDQLKYMEPPDWLHPVRHPLGAILLKMGEYVQAEEVYRQDLKHWPENGWSLFGLAEALKGQGKTAEAEAMDKRFRAAWKYADTPITASCLCVKGKS